MRDHVKIQMHARAQFDRLGFTGSDLHRAARGPFGLRWGWLFAIVFLLAVIIWCQVQRIFPHLTTPS